MCINNVYHQCCQTGNTEIPKQATDISYNFQKETYIKITLMKWVSFELNRNENGI